MRRRLTYANVAATLALVFAMSGGALAANHYLINSAKQINPKLLKKLKGNAGATGASGANGVPGAQGKEGQAGKEGLTGKEGKEGVPGARGPSDVWQAGDSGSGLSKPPLSVSVPAGSYKVEAQTTIAGGEGTSACFIEGGTSGAHTYGATEKAPGITQMTLVAVETTVLSTPGTINMLCTGSAEFFFWAKLTATQVGAIH